MQDQTESAGTYLFETKPQEMDEVQAESAEETRDYNIKSQKMATSATALAKRKTFITRSKA